MKKTHILSLLVLLFSFNSFSQDIDIDEISKDVDRIITKDSINEVKKEKKIIKKLESNWYEGSMVPLISADKNLAIGFRYNNRF